MKNLCVNKLLVSFLTIAFLTLSIVTEKVSANEINKTPLDNPLTYVDNFKIYYDAPSKSIMNQITGYDMAILEPGYFKKDKVDTINSKGTLTFGYLSIMELPGWDAWYSGKILEQDYIHDKNGNRIFIPEWKTYLMDLSSDHYRQVLMDKIQQSIINNHYKGLFLDTVGDIDERLSAYPDLKLKQRSAYISLIKDIKMKYGNLMLIQNWGFETLKESAPYMNGFMWEDFSCKNASTDKWTKDRIKELAYLKGKYGISIFTVTTVASQKASSYEVADGFGFVNAFCLRGNYNKW